MGAGREREKIVVEKVIMYVSLADIGPSQVLNMFTREQKLAFL